MSSDRQHAITLAELEERLSALQERTSSQFGRLEGELKTHREFLFGNGHGGVAEVLARIDVSLQSVQKWQEQQERRALAAERGAKDRASRGFWALVTLAVTVALTLAGWAFTLYQGGM